VVAFESSIQIPRTHSPCFTDRRHDWFLSQQDCTCVYNHQSPSVCPTTYAIWYSVEKISTDKRYSSWRGKGKLLIFATKCMNLESKSTYFYTASSLRKALGLWQKSNHDDNKYITFMCFTVPMAKRQQGDCDNSENVTFIWFPVTIVMRWQWVRKLHILVITMVISHVYTRLWYDAFSYLFRITCLYVWVVTNSIINFMYVKFQKQSVLVEECKQPHE
jgi:hypothetical protein